MPRHVARRYGGRSLAETAGAFAKGARVLYKVTKTVRKGMKRKAQNKPKTSAKKRKTRGPRVKIGAYSGALIASKPVKMAKPGSRIRRRQFGQVSVANRLWIGANNIQSEYYFYSLVAEGIVAYLLKRLNDTRSDKEAPVPSSFLTRVQMNFMRDENETYGHTSSMSQYVDIDLSEDTSFNGIVYNYGATGSPGTPTTDFNPVVIQGVTQPANTGLNKVIFDLASQGYYPEGLFAFRGVVGSTALGPEIFRDTQLGRMNIKIDIDGRHKYQNVTPAGPDGGVDMNVNAIDANPLEGKLMTFRNLAPKYNKGWLIRQGADIATLENFSGRPANSTLWDYKQIHPSISIPDMKEFEAMPLRPTTVFSNARHAGKVRFPPGGFKVCKTKFTYDGGLRVLIRDISQVSRTSDGGYAPNGKYPSLGSSFLMCLLPTIKTTGNEAVTVAFDYVTDGKVRCSMYRGGSLPTTNFIE